MAINFTVGFKLHNGSVSNTALTLVTFGFTQTDVDAASQMTVSANANGITYTYEGTDPTMTLGHPLAAGASVVIQTKQNIGNFKMIRSSGSDATVTVTLEK